MVRRAENKTTHEKLGTRYGCYFSVLLELEYFNAVPFTVVDPMHNLFPGTAKRMFQLWLERDVLTKSKLKTIEERINKLDVGAGFGRLPHKIASNHGKYKASQWKNWTMLKYFTLRTRICCYLSSTSHAYFSSKLPLRHCFNSFRLLV